jgi:hypothetical protein
MLNARLMWMLYEPIHAVVYFTPEAQQAHESVGIHNFYLHGYFGYRSAPLGTVDPAVVISVFYNYAPRMVRESLPELWRQANPEDVLRARSEGACAALARLTADVPADTLKQAADLLTEVAGRLDTAGRVLGAANAALPIPDDTLPRLWQATTTLREHRGDGHNAALIMAGLSGIEVLAWRTAHDLDRAVLEANRGWTPEEWNTATENLIAKGWLDTESKPTETGLARHDEFETATDRFAADAWAGVDIDKAQELLIPIARACRPVIPAANPIGLPLDPNA